MIIVSQDEKVLINFRNVTGIQVEGKHIGLQLINEDSLMMGKYKTEERAKEVLQDIKKACLMNETIEIYSHIGNVAEVNRLNFSYTPVYEIPKE